MGAIYKIINVVDDCFYVGSAVNPRRRKWEHWDALKKTKAKMIAARKTKQAN